MATRLLGYSTGFSQSVFEEFREIGALTIATTHYNRLKLYAETTAGVSNAAMEFNEITLEPTYRLIHGLSGASSGFQSSLVSDVSTWSRQVPRRYSMSRA